MTHPHWTQLGTGHMHLLLGVALQGATLAGMQFLLDKVTDLPPGCNGDVWQVVMCAFKSGVEVAKKRDSTIKKNMPWID